jgi:hypothetical protein
VVHACNPKYAERPLGRRISDLGPGLTTGQKTKTKNPRLYPKKITKTKNGWEYG